MVTLVVLVFTITVWPAVAVLLTSSVADNQGQLPSVQFIRSDAAYGMPWELPPCQFVSGCQAEYTTLYRNAMVSGNYIQAANILDRWKLDWKVFLSGPVPGPSYPIDFSSEDPYNISHERLQYIPHPPMLSTVTEVCGVEELSGWLPHKDAQAIFQLWQHARPLSLVYSHSATRSCCARGLTGVSINRPILQNTQVLSLVHDSGPPICKDTELPFQWFEPELFLVPQALVDKGHGVSRNFVSVWPPENGVNTCTKESPCATTVFLSGIGEHSTWDTHLGRPAEDTFVTIQKWGYLRFAERSQECFETLGSLLLFPQLDRDENWLKDGGDALSHFVVPLINYQATTHPGLLDMDRVSVIGYSEGAFGAMQAAAHFPQVFSMAVAASVSTSEEFWKQVEMHAIPPTASFLAQSLNNKSSPMDFRLKSVIIAVGEFDITGSQPHNVEECLKWLDLSGVMQQAALEVRYYAGLYHKEVWDRLFNRWDRFHEVFWKGRYSAVFDDH